MIDKTKYSPKILSDKFGLEISGNRHAKGMRISVIAEGFIETPKQISQYLFVHEVVNLQKLKVMANNDVKLLSFVNYSSSNKLVSQLELSF
jgi:hypothetical protein